MLHLAIICIVCAASAPGEGTAFIEGKNNESHVLGRFDGGKENLVSPPNAYNVVFRNCSDCADQRNTNKTIYFFNEHILNQYQDSKNSSCSIMERIYPGGKEKLCSKLALGYRKKRETHETRKKAVITPKTLRPPIENKAFNGQDGKILLVKKPHKTAVKKKFELNANERKMFFRLKHKSLAKKKKCRGFKRHLDRLRVDDELDLNKRIEKLVEEIAVENQRKENSAKELPNKFIEVFGDKNLGSESVQEKPHEKAELFPFFNQIRKMFSFSKGYSDNKMKLAPVNNKQEKKFVSDKTAHINSYDILKTMRKINRLRRNVPENSVPNRDSKAVPWEKKKSYSYNGHVNRRNSQISQRRNKKHKHIKSRGGKIEKKSKTDRLMLSGNITFTEDSVESKADFVKSSSTESGQDKAKELISSLKQTKELETGTPSLTAFDKSTESSLVVTTPHNNVQYIAIDQALEKPFLSRESNQKLGVETFRSDCNLMTEFPPFKPHSQYIKKPIYDEYLTTESYLKIRHALHYNALAPLKRSSRFRRKCGGLKCARPHRGWRSPPLLCLPYIRKGQEEQLKYLIKLLQSMVGKPFPPKRDIFEKTKFKPSPPKDLDNEVDYSQNEDYCEGVPTTSSSQCGSYEVSTLATCLTTPNCPQTCPPTCPPTRPTCPPTRPTCPPTCPPTRPTCPPTCPPTRPTCPPTCPPTRPTCPPTCPPTRPTCPPTCPPTRPTCPPTCPPTRPTCPPTCPATCVPMGTQTPFPPYSITSGFESSPKPYPLPRQCPENGAQGCDNSPPPAEDCEQISPTLPFSFPVMGQDVSTTTPYLDDCAKTPACSFSSVTPYCHTPVISTLPINMCFTPSPYTIRPLPHPFKESKSSTQCTSTVTKVSFKKGPSSFSPMSFSYTTPAGPIFTPDNFTPAPGHFSPTENINSSPDSVVSPPPDNYLGLTPPTPETHSSITPSHDRSERMFSRLTAATAFAAFRPPYGPNAYPMRNLNLPFQKRFQPIPTVPYNWDTDSTDHFHYSERHKLRHPHNFPRNCHQSRTDLQKVISNEPYKRKSKSDSRHSSTINHPSPRESLLAGEEANIYRKRKHLFPNRNAENYFNEPRNLKFSSKFRHKPVEYPFQYKDQYNPPTERRSSITNYEIPQNRLFRMRHYGSPKRFKPYSFDVDIYDRYPFIRRTEIENDDVSSTPTYWKDDDSKVHEIKKRDTSQRQKRNDDNYFWPEKFESYNDYFDDPNYSDENVKRHPAINPRANGDNSDSDWTPPAYDMFSELAKAVTGSTTEIVTVPSPSVNKKSTTTGTTYCTSASGGIMNIVTEISKHTQNTTEQVKTSKKALNISETAENITETSKSFEIVTHLNMNESHLDNNSKTVSSSSTLKPSEPDYECGGDEEYSSDNSTTKHSKTKFSSRNKTFDSKQPKTKTSFFLSKSISTQSPDSGHRTTIKNPKDNFKGELDSTDEGQVPTTLKMAFIAKGLKKLVTKPSPKVYSKVYPDSLAQEMDINEMTSTIKSISTQTIRGRSTLTLSPTSPIDLKLKILAVCEGYLEVLKLIKAQNQSAGEELDLDLARYCEGIISQNFNSQVEKPKKQEMNESLPQVYNLNESLKSEENSPKTILNSLEVTEKQDTDETVLEIEPKKEVEKGKSMVYVDTNITDMNSTTQDIKSRLGKKKKRRKNANKQKRQRRTEDENLVQKGVTQEQIELIKLLRKRKKALLLWLLNAKIQTRPGELQQTQYFDEDDMMEPDPDYSQYSGTIKPKRDENASGAEDKSIPFVNESIFPVYAKQYGYDSGGEVREVEVLWRKINEKTHEKQIFKNVSVLALLLTSTNAPGMNREETKLVGSNGYDGEEMSEIQSKSDEKVNFALESLSKFEKNLSSTTENAINNATSKATSNATTTVKTPVKNDTHTFLTKPDSSTFVGNPPKTNKTHQNVTHKPSHRFGTAKDFFQEYSIEFLDYAVYILPIMFTILFLFCCLCCAVHILNARKKHRRKKKKKKVATSSEDSTETTDNSDSESQTRKSKRKRKSKNDGNDEDLDNKRSKRFWNVLKMSPSKPEPYPNEEKNSTENKRSFLRFLKGRKDGEKTESLSRLPLREADEDPKLSRDSGEEKHTDLDSQNRNRVRQKEEKHQQNSEAAERRELIALLEELKKIETENTEEKKEEKSVQVHYMTQENDSYVFQRPNFSYPYEENVFGLSKGYSFCGKQIPFRRADPVVRDCEFYDGVNELSELLPCEYKCYPDRNECSKHCDFRMNREGRCERVLNIFRNSGVNCGRAYSGKTFRDHENETRRFVFNKYKSLSMDESEDLREVSRKIAETKVRYAENAPPYHLRPRKDADLVQDMENFKRQLNKKKHVRLKDDGVLCRL